MLILIYDSNPSEVKQAGTRLISDTGFWMVLYLEFYSQMRCPIFLRPLAGFTRLAFRNRSRVMIA